MGQKVIPESLRIGYIFTWNSRWITKKRSEYVKFLNEDILIRKTIKNHLKHVIYGKVIIERDNVTKEARVIINALNVGLVCGQNNKNRILLEKKLKRVTGSNKIKVIVFQVKNPDLDPEIIAKQLASNLVARQNFRIIQKKVITNAFRAGALGIKTRISGRLNGRDIARSEGYSQGKLPLHTIRHKIYYSQASAITPYGKMGVKVWISRGAYVKINRQQQSDKNFFKNIRSQHPDSKDQNANKNFKTKKIRDGE